MIWGCRDGSRYRLSRIVINEHMKKAHIRRQFNSEIR